MGATLAVVLLWDGQGVVGHVGDCRVYGYRGGKLSQVTRDQTLAIPGSLNLAIAAAAVAAAVAAKDSADLRVSDVLPAQKASSEAELAQAQVELEKTNVRAGVSGRVQQVFLRVGDVGATGPDPVGPEFGCQRLELVLAPSSENDARSGVDQRPGETRSQP